MGRIPTPVQQTGPKPDRRAPATPAALHPSEDLAHLAGALARADFHQRAAVGIHLQQAPLEVAFDPDQKVALLLGRQAHQHLAHAVIAVAQEQALGGLGRQHPLGQHHLRLPGGAQRGGQRVVQAHLDHHGDAHFGKRRPSPPGLGFAHLLFDLWGVGHGEGAAIDGAQAQSLIKRVGMSLRIALGPEGAAHDLLENRDGQERPPLRQRAVGNGLAGKLLHMLGQGASLGNHMKDQTLNQLHGGDERGTTSAQTAAPQYRA